MGGIGKTELALQAAHTAIDRGRFPGDREQNALSHPDGTRNDRLVHCGTPVEACLGGRTSRTGVPLTFAAKPLDSQATSLATRPCRYTSVDTATRQPASLQDERDGTRKTARPAETPRPSLTRR